MNLLDEKKGKRVALSARKNTERERNGSNKKVCENVRVYYIYLDVTPLFINKKKKLFFS